MPKKPKGFKNFDRLMRKLVKVPPSALKPAGKLKRRKRLSVDDVFTLVWNDKAKVTRMADGHAEVTRIKDGEVMGYLTKDQLEKFERHFRPPGR